jgi:FKBP-type peptidyl-prolyl cis-trans isomerase 2
VVVVRYTAEVWRTGKVLPGSYDKGARPQVFAVGRGATLPALDWAVQGQRAGGRVLVVAPLAAAYGTTGSAQLHITGKDTLVCAVDILNVISAHAFLSSRADSGPLPVVIGRGDVIPGWDRALVGQRVPNRLSCWPSSTNPNAAAPGPRSRPACESAPTTQKSDIRLLSKHGIRLSSLDRS